MCKRLSYYAELTGLSQAELDWLDTQVDPEAMEGTPAYEALQAAWNSPGWAEACEAFVRDQCAWAPQNAQQFAVQGATFDMVYRHGQPEGHGVAIFTAEDDYVDDPEEPVSDITAFVRAFLRANRPDGHFVLRWVVCADDVNILGPTGTQGAAFVTAEAVERTSLAEWAKGREFASEVRKVFRKVAGVG